MNTDPKTIVDEDGIIIDCTLNGIELSVGRDKIGEWIMVDSVLFYMDEWTEATNQITEMIVQLRKMQ